MTDNLRSLTSGIDQALDIIAPLEYEPEEIELAQNAIDTILTKAEQEAL